MNAIKSCMRRRPSGSMVVAVLALVLATGGSAVAASVITSKQIKNGTIQLKDLSKRARAKLAKTASARPGPAGPAGDTGKTGPRGPSDAVFKTPGTVLQFPGTFTDVVAIDLPAGNWVVQANVTAENESGQVTAFAACQLELGGTAIAEMVPLKLSPAGGARGMIALNGAGTVPAPGGKAALRCMGTQTYAYFNKPSITATKVETLTAG
ncbi:MAG TPA: hypothetical protein VF072_10955 [Thermoleophilaceae bacterium]